MHPQIKKLGMENKREFGSMSSNSVQWRPFASVFLQIIMVTAAKSFVTRGG